MMTFRSCVALLVFSLASCAQQQLGSESSRAEVEAWAAEAENAKGERLSVWGDTGAYFLSPEVPVDDAGLARTWVHIEWFAPSGESWSNRTLIEFDCRRDTQRALARVNYDERGLRGRTTREDDPEAAALPVTADSIAGQLQRDACRGLIDRDARGAMATPTPLLRTPLPRISADRR